MPRRGTDAVSRIHVLHENDEWVLPLRAAFAERGLPFAEWHLDQGVVDLSEPPPEGVFYNRMSASSHTRGHRYAPEFTAAVLAWLESHGRTVVNGRRALQLEVSKVEQYRALEAFGVRTPRTLAAVGREHVVAAARRFDGPMITKHNRAGKGLGVRLFETAAALEAHVLGPDFEDSVDGITLVQEYVRAPEPFITRCEFVGGEFFYAVRVDTSGGFELCPADVCVLDDAAFCPADGAAPAKFRILEAIDHPDLERYARFLAANDIRVAGIEFILDGEGRAYTYDVNTNTNYNAEAESVDGRSAMGAVAAYLGRELERVGASSDTRGRAA